MKPTILAVTLFLAASSAQTTPAPTPATGPTWQDPGESQIGFAANAETDPVKRLDLLKHWEQQYPNSALSSQRTLMTANALMSVMGAAYAKTDPAVLAAGEKAGKQLEDRFKDYFDDSLKPDQVPASQWAATKKLSETQIHLVLAYIAQVQKHDPEAEAELKRVLAVDPAQASASYQLGSIILHEMASGNDFTRFPEALYQLARSLAVTGPSALPQAARDAAMKALKANYINYHGDASGMDDLITQAANSAFPPDSFQLLSAQQIADQKQQEHDAWAKEHPDLNIWETIKDSLNQQGDAYFSASLKDTGLPVLKGTVVSMPSPKQILVNVNNASGDAILTFDDSIKGDIPAGTELQFKGVADAWTKTPSYLLTLEILDPKTDVTGLPEGVSFVPDKARPRAHK